MSQNSFFFIRLILFAEPFLPLTVTITMNTPSLLAFGLGMPETLLIFAVLLLLFGGKKLPELARGLGKSIKEFSKAKNEVEDEFRTAMDTADREAAAKAAAKASTPAPAVPRADSTRA